MNPRVSLVNLGCRVNRVEIDAIAEELQAAGCDLVDSANASAIVINTCAVTGEAEAKTRKAVRHAAMLPQAPAVVATGCVANLFADELFSLAPNVYVESDKRSVAARVLGLLGISAEHGDAAVSCDTPTPTGRTRPGIKIQDGCDNRCTYCIVWKARGSARSDSPQSVLGRINAAVERGAREVVLTGINLGSYRLPGSDGTGDLPALIDLIMSETSVERIRLSSIEPPDVTQELLDAMARHGERVAPFLHVCLQAGCDRTLKRMERVYDTVLYRHAVQAARATIPDITLGTDLIVGFPGETDDDFDESLLFCKEMGFSKMHVFKYSKRPGTPAAEMIDQIDPRVMASRSSHALALSREMRFACARSRIGQEELALVQYPGRAITGGLLDAFIDESVPVDQLVRVKVVDVTNNAMLVTQRI